MTTNFSSSSNENNQDNSTNNNSENNQDDNLMEPAENRANQRISIVDPLIMGYILKPAKILIEIVPSPNSTAVNNVNLDIKEVQFICPDIDIAPLFEEMRQLKEILKHILDTKQLSQEIGNELVGETYLRWDTQVRFYPTIVFIFLESEEDYLKISVLYKNPYKKTYK